MHQSIISTIIITWECTDSKKWRLAMWLALWVMEQKDEEQNSSTPRLPLSSPTRVLVWRNRAWLPRADESGYVHGAMIEPWLRTESIAISKLVWSDSIYTIGRYIYHRTMTPQQFRGYQNRIASPCSNSSCRSLPCSFSANLLTTDIQTMILKTL